MNILKHKKIVAAIAVSGAFLFGGNLLGATAYGKSNVNVNIEQQVQIDWTKGADSDITAVGISRPDPRGVAMAREAAIMAAQRNLVGAVQGMQIDSVTTMRDLVIANDEVNRRISGTLRGAQILEEHPTEDGGYYVKMRVPIYGVGESIASAVFPSIMPTTPQPFSPPSLEILPPPVIQEVQRTEYSGVIVDASGLGLTETFSPVIYDENGRAVYGISNLQNDATIIERGMVSYSDSINDETARQRAGNSPLIVKAVGVRGGNNSVNNVNVVVSAEDASKILLANEKSHMLENCLVVFVR